MRGGVLELEVDVVDARFREDKLSNVRAVEVVGNCNLTR
jgi:hypothetical protein